MTAPLPRVTEILAATGLGFDPTGISAPVLEAARLRGELVHAGIEALVYGYEAPALTDPIAAPYLDAWRKFLAESGFKAERAEFEVAHPAWRYQGHPAVLGWLLGKRIILDAKTGDQTGVAYQLAGYRAAWNAEHPTEPVEAIAAVKLNYDGRYRFHEIEVPAAERVWLAAVTVFHAQQEQRR